MNLRDYIESFPGRKQRAAVRRKIAEALGVSEGYVRSMCNGHREIPEDYAIPLHKATDGAVPFYITNPKLCNLVSEVLALGSVIKDTNLNITTNS